MTKSLAEKNEGIGFPGKEYFELGGEDVLHSLPDREFIYSHTIDGTLSASEMLVLHSLPDKESRI